jgi:hypothetical protein
VTALYQAHAAGLVRLAMLMLGDQSLAEDVVQDAAPGVIVAGLEVQLHAASQHAPVSVFCALTTAGIVPLHVAAQPYYMPGAMAF